MARKLKDGTLTRSQSYNRAETLLKDAHRDEFEQILAQVYAENGHDYKPRLTPEERAQVVLLARKTRAAEKVAELIAKHGADILPEQVLLPDSGTETEQTDVVS